MPISFKNPTGITEIHVAERLQMMLPKTEVATDMEMLIYFWITPQINGVSVAPTYWDSQPLIIKIADDERLLNAVQTIQQIIGEKRYEQLTAPPEPETSLTN